MTALDLAFPTRTASDVRPILLPEEPRNRFLTALPWTAACVVALCIHGGLFWYLTHEQVSDPAPVVREEAAVMVDMAPEVQQAFSQNDAAVGQPMTEAAEQPPPPDEPKPDMTPPVEDSPSEAVAPLPPKKPKVEKPPEKKPEKVSPKPKKPVEKPTHKTVAERNAGAPRSNRHAQRTTSQSAGVSNNSPAAADWRSQVAASINRVKRYPMGAFGMGSPVVKVSVSASGAVLGATLVASSGNPDFDSEAVAAVRRVGSFPPPPQGATSLPIRLNFHR